MSSRLYEDSDAQLEPDPVTDEEEFCEIEPPLEASTPSVAPGGGTKPDVHSLTDELAYLQAGCEFSCLQKMFFEQSVSCTVIFHAGGSWSNYFCQDQ
jgi:hypothetical protein